ncbi:Uncharacterized protein AB751O23_AX_00130 [Chlamydiales bacterium SCGC AB-751-O23]|nr:Uncharacterized protein AB751O23_AX_00130 [Chlamydiales bacterium SCGC AB-751-O23]
MITPNIELPLEVGVYSNVNENNKLLFLNNSEKSTLASKEEVSSKGLSSLAIKILLDKESAEKNFKEIRTVKGTKFVSATQVLAPFKVTSKAKVKIEEINNKEYRIEPDPGKIKEKLKKEALAATDQQKQEAKTGACKAFAKEIKNLDSEVHKKDASGRLNLGFVPSKKGKSEAREILYETSTTGSGFAESEGRRTGMEDAHIDTTFDFKVKSHLQKVKITGVFDGHGGAECSAFAKENIVKHLKIRLEEQNVSEITDLGVWNALKLTFVDLSRSYNSSVNAYNPNAGSTANISLMIGEDLWIANLGDSRAVLVDPKGGVIQLSEDAKPDNEKYKKGIENRGHEVFSIWGVPRIDGYLAVARSLGDHGLNGAVSARPKVTKFKKPSDGWTGYHLAQCCDGIYDVSNSSQVGELVQKRLQEGDSLAIIASRIVNAAFQAGSGDNLSAVLIKM